MVVGASVGLVGGHRALSEQVSASALRMVHGVGHNRGRWSFRQPGYW